MAKKKNTAARIPKVAAARIHRKGAPDKVAFTRARELTLPIPRDRRGRLDRALIRKCCRRIPGFDHKIIALYARGLSTPHIRRQVRESYAIDISPRIVSAITDSVLAEFKSWQSRPLESMYAIVYFDSLHVPILDEGLAKNKPVHLAIGVRACGHKDVLGLWIEQSEDTTFWPRVINEIKARGTRDILIAVADDLKGFPEAITAVFPNTVVQTCIVHLIRYSMQFPLWNERHAFANALRHIYWGPSPEGAAVALELFALDDWGRKYPAVAESWRRNWQAIIPFFSLPTGVRKIIYTTHALDSLNASLRRAVRRKGELPNDRAAIKLIWLGLRNISENWKNSPRWWQAAKEGLVGQFGERFAVSE